MAHSVAVLSNNHQLLATLRSYLYPDWNLEVFSRLDYLERAIIDSPPDILLADFHFPFSVRSFLSSLLIPVYFITIHPEDKKHLHPEDVLFVIPEEIPFLHQKVVYQEKMNELSSIFVGNSQAIKDLRRDIIHAMDSDSPVLLTGPSGTGKTMAARFIHQGSKRSKGPFYSLNMLSLAQGLIESELFGSVEGAFTDARRRPGYIASAEGGSLFLDEIGDVILPVQGKILYVVENGTFQSVGSEQEKKCNARLMFATNADLRVKVKKGQFREDLYYRLLPQIIHFPSLNQRRDDIPHLASYFLRKSGKHLSPGAQKLVETLEWRGNVRQLKNCLLKAAEKASSALIDAREIKQF